MSTTKVGNEKPSVAPVPARQSDAPEAADLVDALDALAMSEADSPTRAETHRLRGDVVNAGAALERKQNRGPSR